MADAGNDHSRGNMVFHVPFSLNPEATSASGIRPLRMRQAFESVGFHVFEISGRHAQRRKQMAQLRERMRAGLVIDFVYSEAATTPTGLGEPVTLATSLTRDINFLRWCRRRGIPVGLFYRDIYWRFAEYTQRVGRVYSALLRWRYRADLRGYETAVSRLYLPSTRMAAYLPESNRPVVAELPPGATIKDQDFSLHGESLTLLYVGGIGPYYRMHETVRGISMAKSATLILCTRKTEWNQVQADYREMMTPAIQVYHSSGQELSEKYAEASIGLLLMEPIEYRDFAAPMKLFEYLGYGKPVIATKGTLAGQFIEENGLGWTIPYSAQSLGTLLDYLVDHPEDVAQYTERVREIRQQHTWGARALQVASELTHGPAAGGGDA